ncbi:hypothetical protein [Sporosarcina sp. FA9]|uniref:hypothetical protein n=1 Tax=Sporosarcina sp. FA9 TaxID=3413030 RepID=UPI003F65850F
MEWKAATPAGTRKNVVQFFPAEDPGLSVAREAAEAVPKEEWFLFFSSGKRPLGTEISNWLDSLVQ